MNPATRNGAGRLFDGRGTVASRNTPAHIFAMSHAGSTPLDPATWPFLNDPGGAPNNLPESLILDVSLSRMRHGSFRWVTSYDDGHGGPSFPR
jgi:hypothetical protein